VGVWFGLPPSLITSFLDEGEALGGHGMISIPLIERGAAPRFFHFFGPPMLQAGQLNRMSRSGFLAFSCPGDSSKLGRVRTFKAQREKNRTVLYH